MYDLKGTTDRPRDVEIIDLEDNTKEIQNHQINQPTKFSGVFQTRENKLKSFVQLDEKLSMEDDSSWGTQSSLSGSTITSSSESQTFRETEVLETPKQAV